MELRDYIRVIRRRWLWFLTTFLLVVGGYLVCALKVESKIYHANFKLVVNSTRVPLLFQGLESYFPVSSKMSFETRVASLHEKKIQMIAARKLSDPVPGRGARLFESLHKQIEGSRPILAQDLLAALREAHPGTSDSALRESDEFKTRLEEKALNAYREAIASEISKSYVASPMQKTDLIELKITSDSPGKTMAIGNALAEAAIKFNSDFDHEALAKAREEAKERIEQNKTAMDSMADEIKKFHEDNQYNEYETSHQLLDRKAELRRARDELQSQLGWLDQIEQLRTRRESLEQQRTALQAQRGPEDPEVKQLTEQLYDLDLKHAQLLTKPRPGAPGEPRQPPGESTAMGRLQGRREALEHDCSELTSRLAELAKRREAAERRRQMEQTKFMEMTLAKDPELGRLMGQRETEEKRLEEMRARYTENHPEIKAALRSIESLQQQYDAALRKFRDNDAREHTYQLALLDLDKAFLQEELARKDQELQRTSRDISSFNDEGRRNAQHVFDQEKAYLHDELSRKDQEIKELDAKVRHIDRLKFDEQILLERQRLLQEENSQYSTFLGRSSLFTGTQTQPVDRFGDPLNEGDIWAEHTDLYPMLWFMSVIGFLISLGVVFLIEYMDTTLKTEHDIRRHMNLPLLGIIPQQAKRKGVLLTQLPSTNPISEAFMSAATMIRATAQEEGLKTLAVTSTVPREGKTTTSINLAIALARKGARVILIDADLRMPQIHALLQLENSKGLSDFLNPRHKEETLQSLLKTAKIPHLWVMTSGPVSSDPSTHLESVRMKALLEESKAHADFVICDTPPLSNVSDALALASRCDATLFVVGAGLAEQHGIAWAKHMLSHIEAKILGCILNKASIEGRTYYYYYDRRKSYREQL